MDTLTFVFIYPMGILIESWGRGGGESASGVISQITEGAALTHHVPSELFSSHIQLR